MQRLRGMRFEVRWDAMPTRLDQGWRGSHEDSLPRMLNGGKAFGVTYWRIAVFLIGTEKQLSANCDSLEPLAKLFLVRS